MTTIDLTTPPPPPADALDALPRRVSLTLAELEVVADRAGGASLPFELREPGERSELEQRIGSSRESDDHRAYRDVLAALHDPVESLSRRRLLVDDRVDDGLLGAVGLLATPEVALDLDVTGGDARARAWHRHAGQAVATLATADGVVFELAWFATSQWPAELARVAAIPEEVELRESRVPATLSAPYELLDAAAEGLDSGRADVLTELATRHTGQVLGADGVALADTDVPGVLKALHGEARGRLRVLVAGVSGVTTTVVGVQSWTLLDDGWRVLRPRLRGDVPCVDIVAVQPGDLGSELAPVIAEVTS